MEWISVEERLPEVDASVMACRAGEKTSYEAVRSAVSVWYYWGCPMNPPPTHWMPYPEPPPDPGPFYIDTPDARYPAVWCREFGYISTQSNIGEAQEVCRRLNELWTHKGTNDG